MTVLEQKQNRTVTAELTGAYRTMLTIRQFEETVRKEFAHGNIPGFVHLYAGEEAIAVGACADLSEGDWIVSTHRGHGHAIAKGCDLSGMMIEIFGRAGGLCNGKGGSMHLADIKRGMLGANAIVGANAPLICGAGLASQVKGNGSIGVSFTGDGGTNQGSFLESLNLAAVWKLPVVFVVEDNGYGEATSRPGHQAVEDLAARARGFGMPGVTVDGRDFWAVRDAMKECVARARDGQGPSMLIARAPRFYGHYEGDPQTYRSKDELKLAGTDEDCLVVFRRRVLEEGSIDETMLETINDEVKGELAAALSAARAAPMPSGDVLLTDLYA
ncbi:MAG: thiamine pyrophosphate-dependent dehydrogenase E1 component subunit alpha [Microbacteriaceae bacterium]|nr:MAG: thiamine pyrophosphate-dependent dehydrogenase E1 component subunit alpha [Microbacteriaceae bacterium]